MGAKLPTAAIAQSSAAAPRRHPWRRLVWAFALTAAVLFFTVKHADTSFHLNFRLLGHHGAACHDGGSGSGSGSSAAAAPTLQQPPQCPAQKAIGPTARPDITDKFVNGIYKSDAFRNLSVSRLSGAVQIPTEIFDDEGLLGEDPRWDSFYALESYFRETFKLLHDKLELEVVNEHGLLYTWRGSDASLKPILLMSHQDTVPVAEDTLSQWTYPPFSGYFDGTYINGRGAHDCKNNVVAILSSITALLEQDFTPQRTLVVAFGFDEEGGKHHLGAGHLAARLREIYGRGDVFAIIVDEGGIGITHRMGRKFGVPQASEKGLLDLELTVHLPGGHSSVPPSHTSIGILARAVAALEDSAEANFPLELSASNPLYTLLRCAAEDPRTELPADARDAILDPEGIPRVIDWIAESEPTLTSLLHTTQAVTIFHAGNKANALPAYARGLVNYRVSSLETLDGVRAKLAATLEPVAKRFGLAFHAGPKHPNGTQDEVPEFAMHLSWQHDGLEPSPVSSHESPSWAYFSGVIKHVFDEPDSEDGDLIVAPMYAGGNTDTRFYWDLSSQIYRFGPLRDWHDKGWGGIHDVNERIALEAHLEAILFYHEFIRVFDEAVLE
ncbi:hypothetical protein BX600DRAFT_480198 [Xylariales sp. PMI_506]|nr:hypothetical protein BX600DRAFT_480198 [Xylariales sp. PMI_506]